MQRLVAWSVCFLLGGGLAAQEGNDGKDAKDKKTAAASPTPAAASTVVVIYLSDGSRINGTTAIDRLKLKTKYATMEFQLSKVRIIEFSGPDHVAQVSLQNGDQLHGGLVATKITVKTNSTDVVIPLAKVGNIWVRAGFNGGDYVNSLGMEFVLVPGTKVLFSIWDTRVQDYRAYAEVRSLKDTRWENPGFKQREDHPVVMVSWSDAYKFCAWLTQKEREEGKFGLDHEYRLPTDNEWSAAVGETKYPWGNDWPPPRRDGGAGNYDPSLGVDDFQNTSPVGSFKANQYGLYDMGGNVRQWCEDWYGPASQGGRIVRGSSFADAAPEVLTSSYRAIISPFLCYNRGGFRCVLAPVAGMK